MTAQEIKLGFLQAMAAQGLTPSDLQPMEKDADDGGVTGEIADDVGDIGKLLAKATMGAWIGAPVALGGLAGYTWGAQSGPEAPDIEAMREQERINNIRNALNILGERVHGTLPAAG